MTLSLVNVSTRWRLVHVDLCGGEEATEPEGEAPVAAFSSAVGATSLAYNFTDESTDADGTIVAWAWDFGDAGTSSAQHPSHVYAAAGSYTVRLTVTDDQGGTNFIEHTVVAAALQRKFPTSAAAWAAEFPTLPAPIEIWTFDEAASPVVGQVAGKNLVEAAALLYRQAGETEPTAAPRYAVTFDTQGSTEYGAPADTAFGNIAAATSLSLLVRFRSPDNTTNNRSIAGKGAASVARWGLQLVSGGGLRAQVTDGTNAAQANSVGTYDDNAFHDVVIAIDQVGDLCHLITESEDVSAGNATLFTALNASGLAPVQGLRIGSGFGTLQIQANAQISYVALFNGYFTAAHLATFRTEK